MDGVRLGLALRALRIRRELRQVDVAAAASMSRSTVSNVERGHAAALSIDTVARIASVLGADLDIRVRWHGAELDRLLDEGHARLVDAVTRSLSRFGWETAVEVTFSIFGERGSVDVLAWHPASAHLLVVEVKTVVPDFQAMVASLDRKARLGEEIARQRRWKATAVSRLLVIESSSTARDRIARVPDAARAALPERGAAVRAWLRSPTRPIAGLLFVRSANGRGVPYPIAGRQRVRRRRHGRRCRNANRAGVTRLSERHAGVSATRPGCGRA